MIIRQNKHGPRDDLMQAVMKGSGKHYPVACSYPLVPVVKPPGKTNSHAITPHMRVTDRLKWLTVNKRPGYGIAFGLPVMSHSGKPPNPPFFQTHLPAGLCRGETRERLCIGRAMRSAFSVRR
jgi:hypothetical protein